MSYLASLQESLRQFKEDPSKFTAPETPFTLNILNNSTGQVAVKGQAGKGSRKRKIDASAPDPDQPGTTTGNDTNVTKKSKRAPMTEAQKLQRKLTRETNKKNVDAVDGIVPSDKKVKKPRVKRADIEQKAQHDALEKKRCETNSFRRINTIKTLMSRFPDLLQQLTWSDDISSQFQQYHKQSPLPAQETADMLTDPGQMDLLHRAQLFEFQVFVLSSGCRTDVKYRSLLQQLLFNFRKNGTVIVAEFGTDLTTLCLLNDSQWAMRTDIEKKRMMQEKRVKQYQGVIQQDEQRDQEFMKKLMPEGSDTEYLICRACKSRDRKNPNIKYQVDWFQQQTRSADEPMRITVECRNPKCGHRTTFY